MNPMLDFLKLVLNPSGFRKVYSEVPPLPLGDEVFLARIQRVFGVRTAEADATAELPVVSTAESLGKSNITAVSDEGIWKLPPEPAAGPVPKLRVITGGKASEGRLSEGDAVRLPEEPGR